jgi:hypothetical protein
MKVFKVKPDFRFQSCYPWDPNGPRDPEILKSDALRMDCTRKMPTWSPLPIFVDKPELKRGNFFYSWSGHFLIDSKVREVLSPILDNTCELLPFLPYEGETFFLMNVLECVDCLDKQKTQWTTAPRTGERISPGSIKEYYFNRERFSDSTLFKIPEQKTTKFLALTGMNDAGSEFKTIVEREGLTGLKFEEIWSDSGPQRLVKDIYDQAWG